MVTARDVPPVLAQMGSNPVGAGPRRLVRRPDRVGMRPAARVPDRRDMVDIDAEAELAGQAAARLPGLMAGMAARSGGTDSAS